MRCDIIIPVWNQLEVTKECLDSIFGHTSYPFRMIVIDNGSDAATARYLADVRDKQTGLINLIRNDLNLGFVKAVNQGIQASDSKLICIMNNDTIVTDGWLAEMVNILEGYPHIGLVNPSSNTSGEVPDEGESIDSYAIRLRAFRGQIQELYTCRGFCMLVRRAVIDAVGLLDDVYHLGYFDDTDYCKRSQGAGFMTARAKGAYVHHKENTSFKTLEDNKALFAANEKIFFKRWGRPLRIGYFADTASSARSINQVAIEVAHSGHQVNIFMKKGFPWPVEVDHFDIRIVEINPLFYPIISIYKIMKRKNKKKLDMLLTDSPVFGALLRILRRMHKAEVLVSPSANLLQEKIRELSNRF